MGGGFVEHVGRHTHHFHCAVCDLNSPYNRQRTRDTVRRAEAERQRVAYSEGGAKRQELTAVCG